jgi:hypothetical protein
MKKKYYVSKIMQFKGDNEVHDENCRWLPDPANRILLGEFNNCQDAVREANWYFKKVNGCYFCSKRCHTS